MKKIILTAIFLFFSTQAQAWSINAGFENGKIGTQADGPDGFPGGAFKNTKYSNVVSQTGKQSAVSTIKSGTNGFSEFGGTLKFPNHLSNGDEVWFRVWAYFPAGFSFSCGGCTQGVKFMRVHTANANGTNEGYHTILLKDDNVEVDSEVTGKPFHNNNAGKKTVGGKNTRGTWHAYEIYIKFSSQPGKGVYRVWKNGNLIFQDTKTNTLKTSASKSDFIYLFSYWNGGAPKTQSVYIDNIVLTNARPSATDAHGNSFVGVGNYKPSTTSQQVAPPQPPRIQ